MVVLYLNPEFSDSALIVSQQVLILKTSAAWLIADNCNRPGKNISIHVSFCKTIHICALNRIIMYVFLNIYIYIWIYIYIYIKKIAVSQNCVWSVPRCSGRMERRGFVTGLVPGLGLW